MRNKLKLVVYTVATILMFGISGCGGGNSPKGIVEKYVECLEEADFDGMRQMSTGDMLARLDLAERKYEEIAKLLGEKKAAKFKDTYDDLKYEIGGVPSDGDTITVSVKINGQDTPMTLIKLGGKWRGEKFDFPII